jgi:mannose-6-phosphate isomerase-like protein (cupin superfamily)
MNNLSNVVDKDNSPFFEWGEACNGWRFLADDKLSVNREKMPASTAEKLHFHFKSTQFFYIIQGKATIIIEGQRHELTSDQGIGVPQNLAHKIINESDMDMDFLVISSPKTTNDRINIEK